MEKQVWQASVLLSPVYLWPPDTYPFSQMYRDPPPGIFYHMHVSADAHFTSNIETTQRHSLSVRVPREEGDLFKVISLIVFIYKGTIYNSISEENHQG